jgi:aminoglycoside phosphotransferase (APT) family kinase protein
MPYIVGTDLVSLLRDPDRAEWAYMRHWMRSTGMMLAVFHDSHPTPPAGDIAPAGDEVRDTAQRVKLPAELAESLLSEINWRQRCSLSFGDFGPGNLLGTGDGRVYLLDPPDQPEIALPHKDIGNFIFELRRQLAGHGYTRTKPVRGRFHELRDEFLHGYSEGSARTIDSSDRAMISLFEMRRAVGMTRKRFPDRIGDSVWFARSAVARRREVTRADRGHS